MFPHCSARPKGHPSIILPAAPGIIQAGGGVIGVTGGAATLTQTSPSGTLNAAGGTIAVTGGAATLTSGSGGLKLNFVPSASWASAPQNYKDSLVTAANILQAAFPLMNVTANIEIGYGYFEETEVGQQSWNIVSSRSSEGASLRGDFFSPGVILNALAAIPNPNASLVALLNHTTIGDFGSGNIYVPGVAQKTLGLFGSAGATSLTDAGTDGAVGMGPGWLDNELVGVWLHEITHAMGREPQSAPFVFSRYKSFGVPDLSNNTANTYFSLDRGSTHLADYDNSSDVSDFLNGGIQDAPATTSNWLTGTNWVDCFDAFNHGPCNIQDLTTVAKQLLGAMACQ